MKTKMSRETGKISYWDWNDYILGLGGKGSKERIHTIDHVVPI